MRGREELDEINASPNDLPLTFAAHAADAAAVREAALFTSSYTFH